MAIQVPDETALLLFKGWSERSVPWLWFVVFCCLLSAFCWAASNLGSPVNEFDIFISPIFLVLDPCIASLGNLRRTH